MLQYETYRPATPDSWGSDPLVLPTPGAQTPQQRQQQAAGQKPRQWKTLVIISAVIVVLAVVIFVVAGVIMKNTASSNDNIDPPTQLVADLPPELSGSIAGCYTSEAVLRVFNLSGEVPGCIIQKTPQGDLDAVAYYLDTAEQLAAASKTYSYFESRDLSDQAPHSEKLIMHFVGGTTIYVVNAVTADRGFVLTITNSTEEAVLEDLARYGIIDIPESATGISGTEALAA